MNAPAEDEDPRQDTVALKVNSDLTQDDRKPKVKQKLRPLSVFGKFKQDFNLANNYNKAKSKFKTRHHYYPNPSSSFRPHPPQLPKPPLTPLKVDRPTNCNLNSPSHKYSQCHKQTPVVLCVPTPTTISRSTASRFSFCSQRSCSKSPPRSSSHLKKRRTRSTAMIDSSW